MLPSLQCQNADARKGAVMKKISKKIQKETSAKFSEINDCLCQNFMPARFTKYDENRPYGVRLTLLCMMCGRAASGDTPRECVDSWNVQKFNEKEEEIA